jgi:hypothetical protein
MMAMMGIPVNFDSTKVKGLAFYLSKYLLGQKS